jgi:O-antigen ligase
MQHAEIGLGILAELILGKPVGIMTAEFIAVKTGIAELPHAVNWRSLLGYAFLVGIGFAMSAICLPAGVCGYGFGGRGEARYYRWFSFRRSCRRGDTEDWAA